MIFQFMRAIILYAFSLLDSTYISCIFLFPTIFTLENSWIHIFISNSHNIATHIETFVDKTFCFNTSLDILNTNLNNGYIRFWGNFNDLWSWSQNDVVENVIFFDDVFDHIYSDKSVSILQQVQNTDDF